MLSFKWNYASTFIKTWNIVYWCPMACMYNFVGGLNLISLTNHPKKKCHSLISNKKNWWIEYGTMIHMQWNKNNFIQHHSIIQSPKIDSHAFYFIFGPLNNNLFHIKMSCRVSFIDWLTLHIALMTHTYHSRIEKQKRNISVMWFDHTADVTVYKISD